MREIGGYIELETFRGKMLHGDGILLNCGRNALAYLIEAQGINSIYFPKFMCDSCDEVFKKYGIDVKFYSIGMDFKPTAFPEDKDTWLYLVNYYGQYSRNYIKSVSEKYENLIVDNAQSYFEEPIEGTHTLYTCRKFFGVADGAILYTDKEIERALPVDESFSRMNYLLGRFERTASEFYHEFVANNNIFFSEPLRQMSRLTENLLRGIDYDFVKTKRTENFLFLHDKLGKLNRLNLSIPEGPFMYPLYIDKGLEIRNKLQIKKIYIPTLWPDVFELCKEDEMEYDMAANILPLPIDQRYGKEEMQYMIEELTECLKR